METETIKARGLLDRASRSLYGFLNAHPSLQPGSDQDSRVKSFVDLQDRVLVAESETISLRAQIQNVQRQIADTPLDLIEKHLEENPQRGMYQEILRKLKVEKSELQQDYQDDSEPVKDVDEKIARYNKLLADEPLSLTVPTYTPNPLRPVLVAKQADLQASLIRSQENLGSVTAQLNAQREEMSKVGPGRYRLDLLTQAHDRAQQRYNMLSDKLQDLAIRQSSGGETARIIESAYVPNKPVQPRPLVNVLLSLIAAVILGAAGALLQDYLDDRVNDPEDVERFAGLVSLGHVPQMLAEQAHLVSALPSNSHISEAYRTVRSSLGFAALDAPIRRLQITSASQGEGKTLTSVNIATSIALDGKKVILVDADLRRPTVNKVLQLPLSPGLSEVLVGMRHWSEVIQDTEVANLRIISAGAIPPNPAELLGTRAFDELTEELATEADIVIFDTPPCMPVTDPLIVAARMDGVVLVVRANQTRRAAVRYMVTMLGRTRARILGAVFNRVDTKKGGYYYQYYSHYYAGGHGSDGRNGHNGHSGRSGQVPAFVSSPVGDLSSTERGKEDRASGSGDDNSSDLPSRR